MKGQKKEILTRRKKRHSCRPDVYYFLPNAHFLKQLPTHIAHIAKAPQASAETIDLSKSAILLTRYFKSMTEKKDYIRDGRAPIPDKDLTSRIMSAIKGKDTKPELILRKALWYYHVKGYRLNCKKVTGRPDIVFPVKKIAIFVNGCFWHRCPHCNPPMPKKHTGFWEAKFKNNIERDIRNYNLLKKEGWKVFVIWECEIYVKVDTFVKTIKKELSK